MERSATPVTLAHVLDRQVSLQWHEALAIVLALADVLQRSDRLATPGIAELACVAITPAGAVQVLPGGGEGRGPVTDFVHILRALLPADQPVQLRLMLSTVSDASEYETIAQLSDALRYYERPGRTEIIRGVYERVRAAPPLRRREEPPQAVASPPAPGQRHRLRQRWVAVAGAAAVCASVIWLVIALRDARNTGPDGPVESSIAADAWELIEELGSVVSDGARSGLAAIRSRVGSEPVPPAVEKTASPSVTPARRDQPSAPALSDASAGATAAAGTPESTTLDTATSVPARNEGRRGVSPEDEAADAASSGPAARIYSSNDIGVTPPVIGRPQLPVLPPPGVPAAALGVIEVLVSDTGEVESVKLLSPPRNLNERMLLSAVKTWRFQPAMKDGRAVRFRHLVQITVP